jgi:triacylglycerol esterase/lipase EstA (alpha/beta hydrolase family)
MQARHRLAHLMWRGAVAAVSDVAMVSGVYPLLPHAAAFRGRWLGVAMREWMLAVAVSAIRPTGFIGLPGAAMRGPRPVILIHGYAMSRSSFAPLAARLAAAGLGPIVGFEYWSLGKIASAARRLARFVDDARAATGADQVDVVGHSMGGIVGRYYVALGGGDGIVRDLITIGSPHLGTDASAVGVGRPIRELTGGSTLLTRLATAPQPSRTRITAIWSRADALVSGAHQAHLDGAEEIVFDDLGHLSMLASRRVATAIITRLGRTA